MFREGQRVRCQLPVGGWRPATVINPDGKFGYKVDRRKVVPVRYDSGNLDCVPLGSVKAVASARLFPAGAVPQDAGPETGAAIS